MRQRISLLVFVALGSAAFGFYAGLASAPQQTVKLENDRVIVTESKYDTGTRREPHVRKNDQVIVFLDEAVYDSVDVAGKATPRRRQAGDVIWHSKGEQAPLIVSKGKAYRSLTIALK